MFVIKRNSEEEKMQFDKITERIAALAYGLEGVDCSFVTQKVCSSIVSGMTTVEIDDYSAAVAASLITGNPQYGTLAARIAITNHHKETPKKFSECVLTLSDPTNFDGKQAIIPPYIKKFVELHKKELDKNIKNENDFKLSYFGFRTLKRSYLLKTSNKVIERYQYLLMRVAIGLYLPPESANPEHFNSSDSEEILKNVLYTYENLTNHFYTHGSPTLYNSGTTRPQMASCFLLEMENDSLKGIFSTLKNCANITKYAGGIGLAISKVRARNSYIAGTNGRSNGIVPMLGVFNASTRYIDQGGGKRKGSYAVYIEPWHADLMEFLPLRKNTGSEERKCRDLFLALWVPDLFIKKVEENGDWYLMSPDACPKLTETFGKDFERLYESYVAKKRFTQMFKARTIMKEIVRAQIETGMPYILYKDRCNELSNQKNLGCIKSSNLCAEIIEYSNGNTTAVCNLASLALCNFVKKRIEFDESLLLEDNQFGPVYRVEKDKFLKEKEFIDRYIKFSDSEYELTQPQSTYFLYLLVKNKQPSSYLSFFDFERLKKAVSSLVFNLNKAIDHSFYVSEKIAKDNQSTRPLGIGVSGLASLFLHMRLSFDSEQANELSNKIFETIYFVALKTSCSLAKKEGPYQFFRGSPYSEGLFHFEFETSIKLPKANLTQDWESLRKEIKMNGLRNSLFTALMPTASTAQILGVSEAFEPITSNLYARRVLAGDFVCVNPFLVEDLVALGVYNEEMKKFLIKEEGSLKNAKAVPNQLKKVYRTVWEIPQKTLLRMAAQRQNFIDQSQSMNVFMKDAAIKKVVSMLMFGWKNGLKTGLYYLRTHAATEALKFTLKQTKEVKVDINKEDTLDANEQVCLSCSA